METGIRTNLNIALKDEILKINSDFQKRKESRKEATGDENYRRGEEEGEESAEIDLFEHAITKPHLLCVNILLSLKLKERPRSSAPGGLRSSVVKSPGFSHGLRFLCCSA